MPTFVRKYVILFAYALDFLNTVFNTVLTVQYSV